MIEMLGALLLLIGGSVVGMTMAGGSRRQIKLLSAMMRGLEQIERELTLHLTPLPELLLSVSKGLDPPIALLFHRCGSSAGQDTQFSEIWRDTLGDCGYFSEEILDILYPLGTILGRFEGEAQCRSLQESVRALAIIREEMQQESRRLCKVYPTLGFTIGAFLVILLL